MSGDPLGGDTSDPQTLNRYTYVRNNPVNLTDPTGMFVPCPGSPGCPLPPSLTFATFAPVGGGGDLPINCYVGLCLCHWRGNCGIVFHYCSPQSPEYCKTKTPPTKPPQSPQATITADPDWFHGRQAQCAEEGLKAGVQDVLFVPEINALGDAFVQGSPKPLLALVSGGTAVYGAEQAADHVASNRGTVIAIRSALRGEGLRISGNAIGRTAGRISKGLAVLGFALSGKAGWDAYQTCMKN
jgi:hypothetical protein